MATRCNIIVQDAQGVKLQLYRLDDGEPDYTGEELKKFAMNYTGEHTAEAFRWELYVRHSHYIYETRGLHYNISCLYVVSLEDTGIRVEGYAVDWEKIKVSDYKPLTVEDITDTCERVLNAMYGYRTEPKNALEYVDDGDIIAELKRRGYSGKLEMTRQISL